LFGNSTSAHGRVGLFVFGCESCPRTQRGGRSETTDVADLRDQDRGHRRADPVDRLDGSTTPVAAKSLPDLSLEHCHFPVVDLDERTQRFHPDRVRLPERHLVERALPAVLNMSALEGKTPSLAITAWTCALSPDRKATSLAR
jgi:hypothetical protein